MNRALATIHAINGGDLLIGLVLLAAGYAGYVVMPS